MHSGYDDLVFVPFGGNAHVVSIFHEFTSGAGVLNLSVWADDTAWVLLDGVSIFAPVFTSSICSGQPIGCLPLHAGIIDTTFAAGAHKLEFRVFQLGKGLDPKSNPFGLLYTGTVTHTPEPGTLALAGAVLLVIAGVKKRARRSQSE